MVAQPMLEADSEDSSEHPAVLWGGNSWIKRVIAQVSLHIPSPAFLGRCPRAHNQEPWGLRRGTYLSPREGARLTPRLQAWQSTHVGTATCQGVHGHKST